MVFIRAVSIFQSALPRGERHRSSTYCLGASTFQSALPRGERPTQQPDQELPTGFQSALPRGERLCHFCRGNCHSNISIRAPTRGATRPTLTPNTAAKFQSALPRGERPTLIVLLLSSKGFQSALPRGERRPGAASRLQTP